MNSDAQQRQRDVPPWGVVTVLLGLFAVVAIVITVVSVMTIIYPPDTLALPTRTVATTIALALAFIGVPIVAGPVIRRVSLSTLGFRGPRDLSAYFLPFIVLGANLLFGGLYIYIAHTLGLKELEPPDNSRLVFEGSMRVVSYMAMAIAGPVSEEVFFRGFVFGGFLRSFGPKIAIFGSAVIFGLIHLDPGLVIPATFAGILFAWLYHRTGSIWPPIVAHAAQNGLAVWSLGA